MRLCLDARKVFDSGIGTYIRGLLYGFTQINYAIDWDFIVRPEDAKDRGLWPTTGSCHVSRAAHYSLAELIGVSRIANHTRAELFHAPHYVLPWGLRLPAVVTIHDLIHLKMPRYFSPLQRGYARWMMSRVSRQARFVMCVSECTKNDFMQAFRFNSENIRVIYNGIHPRFFEAVAEASLERFLITHGLPRDYLLYVGNLKPHKNVIGLIEAWARMPDSLRPALVIVGARTDDYAALRKMICQLQREREAFFLGEIEAQDLPSAYRGAIALVQPSWYEGFGFPPLEAMACGLPVAASNRSSLPEVLGQAALLFDPAQVDHFLHSLEQIVSDQVLRKSLIARGAQRVQRFTWSKCAEQTGQVYSEVLGSMI